jgi:hypothetical protein
MTMKQVKSKKKTFFLFNFKAETFSVGKFNFPTIQNFFTVLQSKIESFSFPQPEKVSFAIQIPS